MDPLFNGSKNILAIYTLMSHKHIYYLLLILLACAVLCAAVGAEWRAANRRAASCIHSDFEKSFIRAEVIAYDDYLRYGGEHGAKNAGIQHLEGKDYIMREGDVVHFRFN